MKFTTQINQNEYDHFVKNHPNTNLLQSWEWANVKSNWDHLYTGVRNDEEQLIATALVLIKELPGGFTMMYIPRGPIMDYNDTSLLQYFLKELKKEAKKHNALFIKIDPMIIVNSYKSSEQNDDKDSSMVSIFEEAGCIHEGWTTQILETIQPRYQSVVYPNYELPKHTKRLIKDADKRNVDIIQGGIELLDEFSEVVEMTEQRKHVSLRNKEYFKTLMEAYPEDAVIFLAKVNVSKLLEEAKTKEANLVQEIEKTGEKAPKKRRRLEDQLRSVQKDIKEFEPMPKGEKTIAGILSIKYGPICEMLYAGMDERFKKFYPQYKEYVANFDWAFENGCLKANMGGVEGTLDDGLTKFKDNFDPTIEELIGEFDLPVNSLLYKPSKWVYNKRKESMHQ